MAIPPSAVASIEANSPMTASYRRRLLRLLANQAHGEMYGAMTYARGVQLAPSPEDKRLMANLVGEEMEHWYGIVGLMKDLGVSPEQVRNHETVTWFFIAVRIVSPRQTWLDTVMTNVLVDRAAYYLVEDGAQSSYAPWCRFARRILAEEQQHRDLGLRFLGEQIERYGRPKMQRALNKWWRIVLNMFGAPRSKEKDRYLQVGLRPRTNEEQRRAFRADFEPQVQQLGLAVPRLYRTVFPFL
ncbi:MAG: phenylacetate-CoA oxygenase subunit PaaI [Deltaproteobacteria bacterium]|nr:phenylacetate-CoA oxygenase subunit PaaI [Deltaproteobacteria bacterium]